MTNGGASTWSAEDDNRLCDCMADGLTFAAAAQRLGVTRNAVKSRFAKIARRYGAQAA